MNATVTRIVEILFQDTVMNDETNALHDEILRNCQDRFTDEINRGCTEDEAIATVVESLKGMESVIGEYPKKNSEPVRPSTAAAEDDGEITLCFPGVQIRRIQCELRAQEIRLEASLGSDVTVRWNKEDCPGLEARQEGSTLRLRQGDGAHLGMRGLFGAIFSGGDGSIVLGVPACSAPELDCRTLSGDVDAEGVLFDNVTITSTSGDVSISLPDGAPMKRLNIQTASGDVDAEGNADIITLRTMSGDAEFDGLCQRLDATTVSGDMELRGCVREASLKTVSGDMTLTRQGGELRQITAASTSGDITLRLGDVESVHVAMSSVSGDVRCRYADAGAASQVQVEAHTVSGDVTIR